MTRVWVLATLAAILPFSTVSAAAPRRAPAHKAAAKPKPIDWKERLAVAVLTNTVKPGQSLYRACLTSNFKNLTYALDGAKAFLAPEKGEYETSDQWGTRLAKAEEVLNKDRDFVVCLPLSDKIDMPFEYNADTESFAGTFKQRLRVDLDYKELGSYVGRTRMNVSFRISRVLDIEYHANMAKGLGGTSDCYKGNTYGVAYVLPASRARAPAIKSQGYMAFVGKLEQPIVSKADSQNTPSLDDPEERFERSFDVTFTPSRFEIVMPGDERLMTCEL